MPLPSTLMSITRGKQTTIAHLYQFLTLGPTLILEATTLATIACKKYCWLTPK